MSEETFAPKTEQTPAPIVDNFREALVGEGKKYANEEDALKGLYHSQEHIARLEREAKERDEAAAKAAAEQRTLEEVLAAIDAKKLEQPITPPEGLTPQPAQTVPTEAPKEEDIGELIRKHVQEDNSRRAKEANFERAVSALDSRFGSRDATNQAVTRKATELGLNVEFLKSMAEKSPDGFLQLMGASSSPKTNSAPTPASVNTSSLLKHSPNSEPQPGTQRWYKALKKSNPSQYRRLYSQQMRDLEADPDKFYERT